MAREKTAVDVIKDLYGDQPDVLGEMLERFAALGPSGEFGWRYLIRRIEPTEPHRTIQEWKTLERQILETVLERSSEFGRRVRECTEQALPFGECLERAKEGMSPSSKQDKKIIEFCLKWKALEEVVGSVENKRPLEVIARDFHVSQKCIKEIYYDFVEFMVSDCMGEDHYRNLSNDLQEHLKRLFIDTVKGDLTVQEFTLQVNALKRQITRKITKYTLQDLRALPREQARHAMRLFLKSGRDIPEQDLIAWAGDQGLKQDEIDAYLSMRSRDR